MSMIEIALAVGIVIVLGLCLCVLLYWVIPACLGTMEDLKGLEPGDLGGLAGGDPSQPLVDYDDEDVVENRKDGIAAIVGGIWAFATLAWRNTGPPKK
jgi:hypothetical protein